MASNFARFRLDIRKLCHLKGGQALKWAAWGSDGIIIPKIHTKNVCMYVVSGDMGKQWTWQWWLNGWT